MHTPIPASAVIAFSLLKTIQKQIPHPECAQCTLCHFWASQTHSRGSETRNQFHSLQQSFLLCLSSIKALKIVEKVSQDKNGNYIPGSKLHPNSRPNPLYIHPGYSILCYLKWFFSFSPMG